jgi:hypothetical protein
MSRICVAHIAVATLLLLAACDNPKLEAAIKAEEGRVLVKVCRDGTYVWRRRDGSHYVGGLGGGNVEDPNTVCQGGK